MGSYGGEAEPSPRQRRISLSSDIRGAVVEVVSANGAVRACDAWAFGRWECGPDAWNFVGSSEVMVREQPQTCLWMHPVADATLRVTWPDVPAGRVSGRTALSDLAADNADAGPVNVRIRWGGEEVVDREHAPERGWRRFSRMVGTPVLRDGSGDERPPAATADVVLEVHAENVGQRHFCVELNAHPARGR